jgi:hypothetical protein
MSRTTTIIRVKFTSMTTTEVSKVTEVTMAAENSP